MKPATYKAVAIPCQDLAAPRDAEAIFVLKDAYALPVGVCAAILDIVENRGERGALRGQDRGVGDGRDAVRERLHEHMQNPDKGALWVPGATLTCFFHSDTPNAVVESIEGVVASDLFTRTWSQTHPKRWLR